MSPRKTNRQNSGGHSRQLLNQSINLFWTILCFAPVLWYWVAAGVTPWLYVSIGASVGAGVLPGKWLDALMFGRSRRFYERLGVKWIRRWVQDGDGVRSMTGTQATAVIGDLDSARKYLRTIAMYERFHWMCFVFFVLTAILCFSSGRWMPGLLVTVANVLFNLFAIWLQQYNRLRIRRVLDMTAPRR